MLKISTLMHKNLFGECTYLSADAIYATNENHKFTTQKGIQTNFCRKGAGRDVKPTKQIKSLLNKERSTRLEGRFGNEKEHYLLHKIKAKSPDNEQVWLYFGVHTSNAVVIAKRWQKLTNQIKIADYVLKNLINAFSKPKAKITMSKK